MCFIMYCYEDSATENPSKQTGSFATWFLKLSTLCSKHDHPAFQHLHIHIYMYVYPRPYLWLAGMEEWNINFVAPT